MQLIENLVSILARPLLAMCVGAEPESGGVCLQPRRATPAAVAQAVDERMPDREDSLLSRGAAGARRRASAMSG